MSKDARHENALERAERRYDELLAKYHALVDELVKLKRSDFGVGTTARAVRALPDVEKNSKQRAEVAGLPEARQKFIDNMVQELTATGHSKEHAMQEATKHADEAYGFAEVSP